MSSSNTAGGGETIRVSLGPAANAVTSHLCNLEGLACTDYDSPLCDPNITHSVSNDQYVPRVLFVDWKDSFSAWLPQSDSTAVVSTWKGNVETLSRKDLLTQQERTNIRDSALDMTPDYNNIEWITFQSAALQLHSKPHSRYQVSASSQQVSSQYVYSTSNLQRHVDWSSIDDDDNDNDNNSDLEEEDGHRARSQNVSAIETELAQTMESSWNQWMTSNTQPIHVDQGANINKVPWMSYFMPPHPPKDFFSAPLPISQSDPSFLDSFHVGQGAPSFLHDSHWHEQILGEALRRNLEASDAVRGFQFIVDDDWGIFGGISYSLLEILDDECKSAAKFIINIKDGEQLAPSKLNDLRSWKSEQQARQSIRSIINTGLNLSGALQYSNILLPISLNTHRGDTDHDQSLFYTAAHLAMALEAVTLSYRLHGLNSNHSMNGLMNRFFQGSTQGDDWYNTVPKLTLHEFIASLKPSNRHSVLELSSLRELPKEPQASLLQEHFFKGTSIERQRQEMSGRRGYNLNTKTLDPGAWMDDVGIDTGIVTPWTPLIHPPFSRRSFHRHYALCSAFRGSLLDTSPLSKPLRNHISALMEAMCVRFRPENCVGTVVNQSLFELTSKGPASAAGSYWKGLLNHNTHVLSVLGNTTRVFPFVSDTAKGMKYALSRRNFGYITQDTMLGILPERDDCKEALEVCLELRDTYEPPSGSDLKLDDEGTYFDDNLE